MLPCSRIKIPQIKRYEGKVAGVRANAVRDTDRHL